MLKNSGESGILVLIFLYWVLNLGPCACEAGDGTTALNPGPPCSVLDLSAFSPSALSTMSVAGFRVGCLVKEVP